MSTLPIQRPPLVRAACQKACSLLQQAWLKLDHCCQQLEEDQIWHRPGKDLNSIGNLLLHIEGNLRQWALSGLGDRPDRRQRELEFCEDRRVPLDAMLAQLRQTMDEAENTFAGLTEESLLAEYEIQGFRASGLEAMFHTASHCVGHTHQVIYLTRMILGDKYQFHWTPDLPRTGIPI